MWHGYKHTQSTHLASLANFLSVPLGSTLMWVRVWFQLKYWFLLLLTTWFWFAIKFPLKWDVTWLYLDMINFWHTRAWLFKSMGAISWVTHTVVRYIGAISLKTTKTQVIYFVVTELFFYLTCKYNKEKSDDPNNWTLTRRHNKKMRKLVW